MTKKKNKAWKDKKSAEKKLKPKKPLPVRVLENIAQEFFRQILKEKLKKPKKLSKTRQ